MTSLKQTIFEGFKIGVRITIQILLFMIPISFTLNILQYYGLIDKIAYPFASFFNHFGLPGDSVIVYFTGILINCYSAIAVMISLPMTFKEITILSSMILIAHNIPIETMIQKKAGARSTLIIVIRLVASLLIGYFLNLLINDNGSIKDAVLQLNNDTSLVDTLRGWLSSSFVLIIKIIVIINLLTILNKVLEYYGTINSISRLFRPVILFFGLSTKATIDWISANLFGLVYGAGIILAKNKEKLNPIEQNKLHISIGISHSLIQETLIFVVIGASLFWTIIPRIVCAIIAVWIYTLIINMTKKSENLK